MKSALVDKFTVRDLDVWETRSIDLQSYHDRVYYDLERQRAGCYEDLCAALREAPASGVSVDGWVRVTDVESNENWRCCGFEPLCF